MGDAAAAASALPQPAGLNPVEIDELRQARRRTVFLGALATAWEPITEITVEAGQGRADRWQPMESWVPETEFLAEFVLRSVRIGRIVRGKYAEEPSALPFDINGTRLKAKRKGGRCGASLRASGERVRSPRPQRHNGRASPRRILTGAGKRRSTKNFWDCRRAVTKGGFSPAF